MTKMRLRLLLMFKKMGCSLYGFLKWLCGVLREKV